MVSRGVVFVVSERQVYQKSYAVAMSSIVCTLVSCLVRDPRPYSRRGAKGATLRWLCSKDADKIYLVRSANASRF
jgi:hypothetical protein